jgi:glycine/D-amino acid oxidase-like deaminating enzyme
MTMAATHTVVVRSGIVGISTAYYLSHLTLNDNPAEISYADVQDTKREHRIHFVDPAPVLFERVATGRAGGLLARNWFSSSAAELGASSFGLHKKLAERFDGRNKWGWNRSAVINLSVMGSPKEGSNKGLGEGWD